MAESTSDSSGKPTLHHLNHSQSQRILWLLCELFPESPESYHLVQHKRQKAGAQKGRGPDAVKEVHPLGKCPTLVTATGRVITESSAIADYLIATYDAEGRFKGDGDAAKQHDAIREETLCSLAGSSLGLILGIELVFDMLTKQSPFFLRPLTALMKGAVRAQFTQPELRKMWTFLDAELQGSGDFFLGGSNPSKADFIVSWPVDLAVQRSSLNLSDGAYPRLKAWRERCQERPAWKEALKRGEHEYDLSVF